MHHTTQLAAQHMAAIQRQITAIDSYASSNPLNDGQKKTMAIRRKIYVDILHSAQIVFESCQAMEKEIAAIVAGRQLDKLVQKLRDTKPTMAGLAAFKAQYIAGKQTKFMDLNKYGVL